MIHVTLLSHMKNIIKVNYSVLLPVNPNEYNREEMLEKITFFKNKIIDCHEVDGTYQALIGNFYYQIGDYKNAKKYSQEAFETTLDKSNACWTLMQIAVDEEDYESAYEYSKTVLNAKSFRVSLFSLGNYEEALEKISSAEYDLRYYDKLTIDSPSDNIYKHSGISVARCYVLKGIIEYCMDRTDASIETLTQANKVLNDETIQSLIEYIKNPESIPQALSPSPIVLHDEYIDAFITGSDTHISEKTLLYYRSLFRSYYNDGQEKFFWKWSWYSFFFSFFQLFHRKLYRAALISFGLGLFISGFSAGFLLLGYLALSGSLNVYLLYKRFINTLSVAQSSFTEEPEIIAYLQQVGGTNIFTRILLRVFIPLTIIGSIIFVVYAILSYT